MEPELLQRQLTLYKEENTFEFQTGRRKTTEIRIHNRGRNMKISNQKG